MSRPVTTLEHTCGGQMVRLGKYRGPKRYNKDGKQIADSNKLLTWFLCQPCKRMSGI